MKNLDVAESENIMEHNGLRVCKDSEASSVLSSLSNSMFTFRSHVQIRVIAMRSVRFCGIFSAVLPRHVGVNDLDGKLVTSV